tara:strand:+ start:2842 stop:3000 length:159 start_codon:yes stop_codon:yes gene_type:complete
MKKNFEIEAEKIIQTENICIDTAWDYVKDYYSSFGDKTMNELYKCIVERLEK